MDLVEMAANAKKSVKFNPNISTSIIKRIPKENLVAPLYMYPTGQVNFLNPNDVNKNEPDKYFLMNNQQNPRDHHERKKIFRNLR